MKKIQKLSTEEFKELCLNAESLRGRPKKPGVLLTPDNNVIKFYYRTKSGISWSRIWPQSAKLVQNSLDLARLNIASMKIIDRFIVPFKSAHVIIYPHVEGLEVVNYIRLYPACRDDVLTRLASFVAKIHSLGVSFADLHLNNIIQQENGKFVLIDIGSIKVLQRKLKLAERVQNLSALMTQGELLIFVSFGVDKFLQAYFRASTLSVQQQNQIYFLLRKRFEPICKQHQHDALRLARFNMAPIIVPRIVSVESDDRRFDVFSPVVKGALLSELLKAGTATAFDYFASFIADLHKHGVVVRSWHFDNVMQQDNGCLNIINTQRSGRSLIKLYRAPLCLQRRAHNLAVAIKNEIKLFNKFGIDQFVQLYLEATDLPEGQRVKFHKLLQRQLAKKLKQLSS
ncbi:MAG: hypothetical protein KAT71_04840 [Gammaproteobacteria bacterium]|nr:hypothetical protein [Gammaproteobacteria bacterium]